MAFEASRPTKRSARIQVAIVARNLVSLLFYLHSWRGLPDHSPRQIQILEQGNKTVAETSEFVTVVVPGLWFVFQRKSWNFSKRRRYCFTIKNVVVKFGGLDKNLSLNIFHKFRKNIFTIGFDWFEGCINLNNS